MTLCQVCFQPECPDSTSGERPGTTAFSSRVDPGRHEYRGYGEWAIHPDEARYVLHRGYAIVDGQRRHVKWIHNEAFVTQIYVDGTRTDTNTYAA
jgi:hypothetical protein